MLANIGISREGFSLAGHSSRDLALRVVRVLSDAGHRALFAGGCVRDMLLGRDAKDYDVATAASPEQTIALFPRTLQVGAAFGVVCVLDEGDNPAQVEVATFRGETTYSDGRHPDRVHFTDEVEDVKRRDFTINGLLYDPLKDEVLDYVGGKKDLERRSIRAIGDPARRFSEDRLRMLRAVRFASALRFEIDGTTFGAIKKLAEGIGAISAERIRDELNKMLTGPAPRRAMELLRQSRLLKYILPEVDAMEGVPQPPQFHPEGDVWTHTMIMLDYLSDASLTLALATLLHDVGKPVTIEHADRIRFNEHEAEGAIITERLMERLKYSREEIDRVVDLVRQHMAFKDAPRMRPAKLKRFLRQEHFDEHMELHRLDCLSSHGSLDVYDFCRSALEHENQETLRPEPLVSGHDLIAMGLRPGPLFKELLEDVEDRQLEGSVQDRDGALLYLRKIIQE